MSRPLRCAALLALLRPISARTFDRFDSFKFLLGDPRAPPQCTDYNTTFTPLNGLQCLGFSEIPANGAAACAAACCVQPWCAVWTYNDRAGCWTSSSQCSNFLNDSSWSGGSRTSPVTPGVTCNAGDPCAVDYDDSTWRTLTVPHDFGVEAAFDKNIDSGLGALPKNVSWYRRTFVLDAAVSANALIYLEFDGVFRSADVFLNGEFVLHHEEGYTPFIVWLHNASAPVRTGGATNVLAVFVNGLSSELWSYEGMGITRHVWLGSAPAVSVTPWSLFVPFQITGAIHGSASEPQTADGVILSPQVDIANAGDAVSAGNVTFTLADASGATVCLAQVPFNVTPGGWQRVYGQVTCTGPVHLWNTAISGAYLHNVTATLTSTSGSTFDSVSTRIGLRSTAFTAADGFTLNGEKLNLHGFSNHVGFGGCGGAVPDRVLEFQLTMLQKVGGNSLRTAHNPVAREFLDLADEYGVLIWEENRFITAGVQPSNVGVRRDVSATDAPPPAPLPVADPRLLQDCQDMVLRDRNHPSIHIWSLCNELGCVADNPDGHVIAAQFKNKIYAADNSRPITGNIVQRPYLSGRLLDEFGLSMDVTAFSHQVENVPAYRAFNQQKSVGLGESGSCTFDRGEYAGSANRSEGHLGFDAGIIDCIRTDMDAIALPYSFGMYSWTLSDYLGETYPTGWPAVSSHFGLFDLAGYAKDSAGFYAAVWGQERNGCTGISIGNSDWSAPVAEGSLIDVAAYTCSPSAELLLNGVSLGVVPTVGGGAAVWRVAFSRGNLTALARDASGAALGSATLLSAGPPARLRLWVEDSYRSRNGTVIAADGADVALLGVAVEDANGLLCPRGALNISFSIVGPAAMYGVSNGDPADHSPVKMTPWRLSFHGLARAIISSTGSVGDIFITASALGVNDSTAHLVAA